MFAKILLPVLVLSIFGCSPKVVLQPRMNVFQQANKQEAAPALSWHAARFQIEWTDREKEADLSSDLLLAHAVIKPVLINNNHEIPLWRFHRRANDDATGHEFTFYFYTDEQTASNIESELKSNRILQLATKEGLITKFASQIAGGKKAEQIEGLSDNHWSATLQRAWPTYAMGSSALWLNLVSEAVGNDDVRASSTKDLLSTYEVANKKVTKVWHDEASHALLHHLNAIFGYEPLNLRKMNF